LIRPPLSSTLFPYTTLFRSWLLGALICLIVRAVPRLRLRRFLKRRRRMAGPRVRRVARRLWRELNGLDDLGRDRSFEPRLSDERSEEHTSELQSRFDLVCRL